MLFWEGSNTVTGTFQGEEVAGHGFLETFGDYNPIGRGWYKTGM